MLFEKRSRLPSALPLLLLAACVARSSGDQRPRSPEPARAPAAGETSAESPAPEPAPRDPAAREPIDPAQPMPEESLTIHASLASGDEATVRIDGRSDLFSAGMDAAHAERGGVLPAAIELAPGGGYITLVSVRGKVGCGPGQTSSPDGGSCAGGSTNLEGASGLSGIVNRNHSQFLGGVFLGPETPEPPPALDFSEGAKGESFAELQPKLGQTFFIGDGLTGTGTGERQRFHIPDGATTLYLGYADGYNFQGKPSYYADNTGGLSVTLTHSPAGEDETGD